VPAHGPGRCPNCAAAWEGTHNCPRCLHWDALDGALAAFEMGGPARAEVHALKYGRATALVPLLAADLSELPALRPFDVCFPVPLHRSRWRSRGFNQAELILAATGWPRAEGRLERRRKTRTQVGLELHERKANVAGAFAYSGPRLEGRRLALIDDVITTGATANECARVLKDHGARQVVAFAFARASDPHVSGA
jgi:ComF family protein